MLPLTAVMIGMFAATTPSGAAAATTMKRIDPTPRPRLSKAWCSLAVPCAPASTGANAGSVSWDMGLPGLGSGSEVARRRNEDAALGLQRGVELRDRGEHRAQRVGEDVELRCVGDQGRGDADDGVASVERDAEQDAALLEAAGEEVVAVQPALLLVGERGPVEPLRGEFDGVEVAGASDVNDDVQRIQGLE